VCNAGWGWIEPTFPQISEMAARPYGRLRSSSMRRFCVRDEFTQPTKDRIARRAGWVCSNPDCRCATVGAAEGDDGVINVGVAAHITAASSDGPRYDPSLTSEQRRHHSNGIWLCQKDAKAIDSDEKHFTVEMLQTWKRDAERRSFQAIVAPGAQRDQQVAAVTIDAAVKVLIVRLGLPAHDDIGTVAARLIAAVATPGRLSSDCCKRSDCSNRLRATARSPSRIARRASLSAALARSSAAGSRVGGALPHDANPASNKHSSPVRIIVTIMSFSRCCPF